MLLRSQVLLIGLLFVCLGMVFCVVIGFLFFFFFFGGGGGGLFFKYFVSYDL